MGMVRCYDNVLMIIFLVELVVIGCKWWCCFFLVYVEGFVIICDENQNVDVILV